MRKNKARSITLSGFQLYYKTIVSKGFLGGTVVKSHLLPMQEMQVRPLGQKDHLEKEMATHSYILAWEIPWTEEPGRLQTTGSQKESDITSN